MAYSLSTLLNHLEKRRQIHRSRRYSLVGPLVASVTETLSFNTTFEQTFTIKFIQVKAKFEFIKS